MKEARGESRGRLSAAGPQIWKFSSWPSAHRGREAPALPGLGSGTRIHLSAGPTVPGERKSRLPEILVPSVPKDFGQD